MLARDEPGGEPIATPSICRFIISLKLNSTEEVAVCISSTKITQGKEGGVSSPLYRASGQILRVPASGTLVRRTKQRKTDEEKLNALTRSVKELEIQWVE